ncbi:MAG: hypothetical protein B6I25_00905 [Planctomycetales bacterium 4572_13]|nr:MAG: hypothetical protein B6I25_00905 [Planctomycetales bacterium 4572_13]
MGSVYILLMVVLLGCSAFFSGSETAFFQLSPRTVRQFAASKNRTERLIAATLADPGRFLTALLFGNMLINVLYFALTSTLSFQLTRSADSVAGGASIAVGGFILLLLFGEMLPKSLAYTNTHRFCLATAAVCYLLLKILGPLVSTLDWLIARPVIRLLVQPQTDTGVSTKQLKVLLDSSRQQGAISSSENQLMSEILKFSFLKVRHVMKPRVEMPACSLQMPPQAAIEKMMAALPDGSNWMTLPSNY